MFQGMGVHRLSRQTDPMFQYPKNKKKIFLLSSLNLLSFRLKSLRLVMLLWILLKCQSPDSQFVLSLLKVMKGHNKNCPEPSIRQAEQSQFSPWSPWERCFILQVIFMTLLWTSSSRFMAFLCWSYQSSVQPSRWCLTRTEQEGQNSLPSPADHTIFHASQVTVIILGFWAHKCVGIQCGADKIWEKKILKATALWSM